MHIAVRQRCRNRCCAVCMHRSGFQDLFTGPRDQLRQGSLTFDAEIRAMGSCSTVFDYHQYRGECEVPSHDLSRISRHLPSNGIQETGAVRAISRISAFFMCGTLSASQDGDLIQLLCPLAQPCCARSYCLAVMHIVGKGVGVA